MTELYFICVDNLTSTFISKSLDLKIRYQIKISLFETISIGSWCKKRWPNPGIGGKTKIGTQVSQLCHSFFQQV